MIPELSERSLILAPAGRDAKIASSILREANIRACPCGSTSALVDELKAGAGFAMVTSEALKSGDLNRLHDWIQTQPEWSDFPFILLVRRGGGLERNPEAAQQLQLLNNVTFLERPFHPTTLVSLAQAALRGRRRQYEARSRMAELRDLAASLEQQVVERTAGLEQARDALFQSQKMEAIGKLTGGIAHDFNNLLMAIMSSIALLKKRMPDDPQAWKLLNNAVQGAERGATLTQRMLAFARRQDLQTEYIEVPDLVRGMTDLLQRSLGPAWSLETGFPSNLSGVLADANQLEMALLNLVVNARDAMPDGGAIRIEASECYLTDKELNGLAEGRYVNLSIIDRGIGMDADTLDRAMEPFFTTKGVGKGTGLGLSMVHGVAQQLEGAFVLESVLGQGTSAQLWLPAAKGGSRDCSRQLPLTTAPVSKPLIILAVDDDILVLMNTAAILEDLGHTVLEAGSGKEALTVFEARPDIDVLVTDQAMPGMTGIELAATIRTERPALPIILATGYGELPANSAPTLRRLAKPYSQSDLARALAEVVQP